MTTRLTCGPAATDVVPAEFADRMRGIAQIYTPGSPEAAKRALTVVVETLLSNGYADGVEVLERLLAPPAVEPPPPPADPLGAQAAEAATSVGLAIQESGQAP